MTRGTLAIVLAAVAVLAMLAALVWFASRPAPQVNGTLIVNALAKYANDLRSRREPMPESVTLDTLVRGGYLRADEMKGFEGVELIFHREALDTMPQSILVEARLPDGSVEAVLADGSVQQFSPQSWRDLQSNSARLNQPMNPGLLSRPSTNATP